jgi:hypothetical protein
VRAIAADVRTVGRNLRITVNAPAGALVHVYRDGQLVKSVTPEEAKALTIPAAGATTNDVQLVVVTRTGEVMSTPPPAPQGDSANGGATPTPTSNDTATTTTVRAANAAGGRKSPTTSKAAGTKSSTGKSSSGKAGQRSTSDTTKSGK